MPPLIPYRFDPSSAEYEEHHLVWEDVTDGHNISWPLIGARIVVPKATKEHLADLTTANGGRFKSYRQIGFTLGSFSEFFVTMPNERHCGFKMGNIEATFGECTPLAAMIFDPFHREKWFGPWDSIMSVRIVGAGMEGAELALLNALTLYEERFGVLPDMFPIDPDFEIPYEPADAEPQVYRQRLSSPTLPRCDSTTTVLRSRMTSRPASISTGL